MPEPGPVKVEGKIAIVPIGSVSKAFARELGEVVSPVVELEYEVLLGLAHPEYAHNPARDQYHASSIVRRVAHALDPKRHALGLGVADVDLFLPDLNFVFGDADRAEKAGVVSIARLDPRWYGRPPDHALLLRRAAAEGLHELGHLLGLPNCQNDACAMYLSNTLSDTDRKRPDFCDHCKAALASDLPPGKK